MPTFNKFQCFVADVGTKVHNLNADTLKILLTNVAPVATNTVKANLTEISAGNGYSAGGTTVASTAYSQTSGTAKLIGNAVTFSASGGPIGPYQYAVLYNATAASGNLIGWWDNGGAYTIADGSNDKIAADTSGSNWSSSLPILSIA